MVDHQAESEVLWSVDADGVGCLALNRPDKHNAQTPAMWDQIRAAGLGASTNPNVRSVVVRGNGPSFSAGLDLDVGLADIEDRMRDGADLGGLPFSFDWLRYGSKPTVAAVHGHAYGAGLQLALACDIRIFADDAVVGLLEPRHGLVADMGATELLPRIVGAGVAADLLLTGRTVDAQEAVRLGLASRVVPADKLHEEVRSVAEGIARFAPEAMRAGKEAMLCAFSANGESHRVAARRQADLVRAKLFGEPGGRQRPAAARLPASGHPLSQ